MRTLNTANNIFRRSLAAAALAIPCWPAAAQEPPPKAIIALVGDTDKFNIGQNEFCGDRSEINSPSGKQFRIPSNKLSFFYIRTKFRATVGDYICEGDYSFTPSSGQLYIIRYTMTGHCTLEVFESEPGGSPTAVAVHREASRSCLFK